MPGTPPDAAQPARLYAEQIKLLRETARREGDLRDHMLFSLALGTGLRVAELVALDVSVVDRKDGNRERRLTRRDLHRVGNRLVIDAIQVAATNRKTDGERIRRQTRAR